MNPEPNKHRCMHRDELNAQMSVIIPLVVQDWSLNSAQLIGSPIQQEKLNTF